MVHQIIDRSAMTRPARTWLSAHLYYAEPWEEFLIRAVKPFVNRTITGKRADRFFFIRYWERGPHIRLRLRGEKEVIEHEIKPELESYFLAYFQQHPSQRTEPPPTNAGGRAQRWFPNHTVQFIEYQPEVDRYGGPAGCRIAEKQFAASSRAVLSLLQESKQWNYERALGAALQLHIAFAFALGMSLAEASQFYSDIFELWWARLVGVEPNATLKAFEEKFAQQRSFLTAHLKTLWNALTAQVRFDQGWLNKWLHDMAIIGKELKQAQKKQRLTLPQASQELLPILHSYVHMTNNRLGILNRDEAYLGYLLNRSFECLQSIRNY